MIIEDRWRLGLPFARSARSDSRSSHLGGTEHVSTSAPEIGTAARHLHDAPNTIALTRPLPIHHVHSCALQQNPTEHLAIDDVEPEEATYLQLIASTGCEPRIQSRGANRNPDANEAITCSLPMTID
jgi:hypothetical protein